MQQSDQTFQPMPADAAGIVSWVHLGDLHMTTEEKENYRHLQRIVSRVNTLFAHNASFVFLPGDQADHGDAQAYRSIRKQLDALTLPWCAIVGDHDVHGKSHKAFQSFFPGELHYAFSLGSLRFIALNAFDVAEPSSFTMLPPQLEWLEMQLKKASSAQGHVVLLLHCYPGDLKRGRAELQRLVSTHKPLLIDMGHTHYNEISNDGATLYSATRSTGQIEEGDAGYSVISIDGDHVSWRFVPVASTSCLTITSPPDYRLQTRAASATAIRAKVWSEQPVREVTLSIDGGPVTPMQQIPGSRVWQCSPAPDGATRLAVVVAFEDGTSTEDTILLQGPAPAKAESDHEDRHAIGAWPEHGLLGTQLGPNKNGRKW